MQSEYFVFHNSVIVQSTEKEMDDETAACAVQFGGNLML